jgi:hypothetical protein
MPVDIENPIHGKIIQKPHQPMAIWSNTATAKPINSGNIILKIDFII